MKCQAFFAFLIILWKAMANPYSLLMVKPPLRTASNQLPVIIWKYVCKARQICKVKKPPANPGAR